MLLCKRQRCNRDSDSVDLGIALTMRALDEKVEEEMKELEEEAMDSSMVEMVVAEANTVDTWCSTRH